MRTFGNMHQLVKCCLKDLSEFHNLYSETPLPPMATLAAKSEWTKQIDLGLSIVDLLLKATFICNTNQERQRLSTLMKIFCEVTSARRLRR